MESNVEAFHPGRVIKLKLLILGISITAAARALGVNRTHLSDVVNGHAGVSPMMALRLSFGIGDTAEKWMQHQIDYELQLARGRFLAISHQIQKIRG